MYDNNSSGILACQSSRFARENNFVQNSVCRILSNIMALYTIFENSLKRKFSTSSVQRLGHHQQKCQVLPDTLPSSSMPPSLASCAIHTKIFLRKVRTPGERTKNLLNFVWLLFLFFAADFKAYYCTRNLHKDIQGQISYSEPIYAELFFFRQTVPPQICVFPM